jgi:hypothetical protein
MPGATTRRELLVAGARAGAGGAAATALIGAGAAHAAAPASEVEATRLERLLSVELLMQFCYTNVLDSSVLTPHAKAVLTPLRAQEEAHIRALRARLAGFGERGPQAPDSVAAANRDLARRSVKGRLGQLQGSHDALHLLLALERVVVGAYFVALTKLPDPKLITLSAQIMAADAQHGAIIGELLYPGNAQNAVPSGLVQGVQ